MTQDAWRPWKQNITCKRLDLRRVRGIDYLGLVRDLRAARLEANFSERCMIKKAVFGPIKYHSSTIFTYFTVPIVGFIHNMQMTMFHGMASATQ